MNVDRMVILRNRFAGVTGLLLLIWLTMFSPVKTVAAVAPSLPETEIFYLTESRSENRMLNGITKKSAVSNLKSSRKSVASVSLFKKGKEVYLDIKLKKAGKTTISCDVSYEGRTIHLESLVKVKKYKNPFKKFLVGETDYADRFAKGNTTGMWGTLKGKLSLKMKKGFKVVRIISYSYSDASGFKELKRGKKIRIKPGYQLQVVVMDKKDGDLQEFSINME